MLKELPLKTNVGKAKIVIATWDSRPSAHSLEIHLPARKTRWLSSDYRHDDKGLQWEIRARIDFDESGADRPWWDLSEFITNWQKIDEEGFVILITKRFSTEESLIEYLRAQQSVPLSGIGVIGMSQGGWIAPIVASQEDDLSFLVSMVGSAVTPREQLLYEENHNLRQLGFLPGISNVLAYAGYANVRYLAQPQLYDLIVDYDPLPHWRNISIDSLILLGAEDTNVPTTESAKRLVNLDNPHIRVEVYPGSGHALESPFGQGNSIIRKDALNEISAFIHGVDLN